MAGAALFARIGGSYDKQLQMPFYSTNDLRSRAGRSNRTTPTRIKKRNHNRAEMVKRSKRANRK